MTLQDAERLQVECLRELEKAREHVRALFRRANELDRLVAALHRPQ